MASPFRIGARAGCLPRCERSCPKWRRISACRRRRAAISAPGPKQGVLLLNTALTVEAGLAGAHKKLGWSALVEQAVSAVSDRQPAVVFLLWGAAGAPARGSRRPHETSGHRSRTSLPAQPPARFQGFSPVQPGQFVARRARAGAGRLASRTSRLRFASINHDGSWCASKRPEQAFRRPSHDTSHPPSMASRLPPGALRLSRMGASARVGERACRTGLCAGRQDLGRAPCLDVRQGVLGLCDPGSRQKRRRTILVRGIAGSGEGEHRIAGGIRLFHGAEDQRQEAGIRRSPRLPHGA